MNESEIRRILKGVGLRATVPRLAILVELSRSHIAPKSAAELTATLSQFPRSTIYRSLLAMERKAIVKSSLIKWVRRYELGDDLMPHHHHITCLKCGKVNDFDSTRLEQQLAQAAKESGYSLKAHTVELRGFCADCDETPQQHPARVLLSYGIESMKKLRPRDPLMEKLLKEDSYEPFDDTKPTRPAGE